MVDVAAAGMSGMRVMPGMSGGVGGAWREQGAAVLDAWRGRMRLVAADEAATSEVAPHGDVDGWVAAADAALASMTADAGSVAPAVVSQRLRSLGRIAERVTAATAVLTGVLEESAQHAVEGASSATAWLVAHADSTASAARRTVAVGRLVRGFADTAAALDDGCLSATQAEVLAAAVLTKGRAARYERDEAVLLRAAEHLSNHEFAQAVRRWVHLADDELDNGEPTAAFARRGVSFARLSSGNLRINGELDATGGAMLEAAFAAFDHPDPVDDDACPPRSMPQRRADFLAALAARALSGDGGQAGAPAATVEVVVDLERLARAVPGAFTSRPGVARDGCGCGSNGATGRCGDGAAVVEGGPGPPTTTSTVRSAPSGSTAHRGAPARAERPGSTARAPANHGSPGPPRQDPSGGGQGPGIGLAALLDAVTPDPSGWGDATTSGPLPLHTLAQLLCDCSLGRLLMAGPSEVLDLGRRRRTFTAAQRRAIVARDRHCTHPRCTRGPEWCQIHHVDDWDAGGDTNIANGTLLCLWHHTWHHVQQRLRRLDAAMAR